jgi:uncharacterized RDD family membrane protein YckC
LPQLPPRPVREFASLGSRFAAALVDLAVVLAFILVCGLLGSLAGGSGPEVGVALALFVGWLVYMPLMVAFRDGQTLGKQALGIRVVRKGDRGPAGIVHAIGREWSKWLLSGIPGINLGDAFYPLLDEHNQSWFDKLGGTVVIPA